MSPDTETAPKGSIRDSDIYIYQRARVRSTIVIERKILRFAIDVLKLKPFIAEM